MKNFSLMVLAVAALVATSAKADWRRGNDRGNGHGNYGRTFVMMTDRSGVAVCDDVSRGGQYGSRVQYCEDRAHGNNHGCYQIRNGCQAWEGPGNGGNAVCAAICSQGHGGGGHNGNGFYVRYYGRDFTSCSGPGGRPGARAYSCVDVGNGRNHGCTLRYDGCQAWEGPGNGGSAACDAQCR